MNDDRRALRQLARLYDVQESYTNVFGRRVRASVESSVAVLRAMGAPLSTLPEGAQGRARPAPARAGDRRMGRPAA